MTTAAPADAEETPPGDAAFANMIELARALVSDLDLESVLRSLLDAARDLTGARYAALGVLTPDRRRLERFITVGVDDQTVADLGPPPEGHGVLGALIRDPRPLRLADLGEHPQSFGLPFGHPPMRNFLGVPLLVDGQAWGNLYLTESIHGAFRERDERLLVLLAGWASIAIANAGRHGRERSRRTDLEQVVVTLQEATDLMRMVGGEADLDRLLELIVKRGRAVADARSMLMLLRDGDALVVTAIAGELPRGLQDLRVTLDESVARGVLDEQRSVHVAAHEGAAVFAPADAVVFQTGLLVPLGFRGEALGVLAAFDPIRAPAGFSDDDRRLLEAFAASAAIAVAAAMNVDAVTLRLGFEAFERDRARWASQLRDDVLEESAALKLTLAAARSLHDPAALERAVDESVATIADLNAALRRIIGDLRPATLDAFGIEAGLEALVERTRTTSGIDITLDASLAPGADGRPRRLAPALEQTIYRVVQEAVANALMHAGASSIAVSIAERDDHLEIVIRDDGAGFDVEAPADGFGLPGLRERALQAGGSLDVSSAAGAGTTVTLVVPASS